MSSATALTGRNGKLLVDGTQVARCTQWQVSPKLANTSEWGDSDSGGYTNRAAGRRDATFTTEGKYDTGSEVFDLFMPEDIVIGLLYLDVTRFWNFPRALCMDFGMSVNIDTEEVISWQASFGADGTFTKP